MSENKRICPYCGSELSGNEVICPNCGAYLDVTNLYGKTEATGGMAMAQAQEAVERSEAETAVEMITEPKTIEELQLYCEQHGMPLLRMRFFIGENYQEPRAFGIYKEGNEFIVYKNKDTGVRAIRYRGTDEAFAVNEIFQKLLSECHNRGVYPDGNNREMVGAEPVSRGYKQKSQATNKGLAVGLVIVFISIALIAGIGNAKKHKEDGYYQFGNDYYYRYGDDWSFYDFGTGSWSVGNLPDDYWGSYTDYYIDDSYYSDWGVSDVRNSSVWDDWHSSNSDSSFDSSYDSWDSSGTDWGSDW